MENKSIEQLQLEIINTEEEIKRIKEEIRDKKRILDELVELFEN